MELERALKWYLPNKVKFDVLAQIPLQFFSVANKRLPILQILFLNS